MAGHTPKNSESQSMYEDGRVQTNQDDCPHCQRLIQMLSAMEMNLSRIEQKIASFELNDLQPLHERAFYSVTEFAELVHRSEYTVREWCRLYRINSEKCDSGHGDSKLGKFQPMRWLATKTMVCCRFLRSIDFNLL